MARLSSTALLVVLLAATAGAFALTQGAKLELAPIYDTSVDKTFSPTCRCGTNVAHIDFRLRKTQRVSIWIERSGHRVATLASNKRYRAGRVAVVFRGRSVDGLTLPDGTYQPVVHLGAAHDTIRLPNPIALDTTAPVIAPLAVAPPTISPDGDVINPAVYVGYRLNGAAHAILIVAGHGVVEFTRFQPVRGRLVWYGRFGARVAHAGTYRLLVSAEDPAGNRTKPVVAGEVRVAYVTLSPAKVSVAPGASFSVRAVTDAKSVGWLFAGVQGRFPSGRLTFAAPTTPGTYTLYVTVGTHAARTVVTVG